MGNLGGFVPRNRGIGLSRARVGRRASVVLLVILVAIGLFGPAASQLMPQMAGLRELAEAMALAPRQQWGKADGLPHEVAEGFPNQDKPVSLQSKYPGIGGQQPAAARNNAEIKTTSADVRGFDTATSKELPDQRGERERTFRNADGTLTSEFSQNAVNYRKPDGSWAPIDTTFVGTADGWRNAADRVDLRLADRASADSIVRLRFDDEHEVSFGLQGTAASAGVATGSTVTYPRVLPGVDLKFEAQSGGVKEVMVLKWPTRRTPGPSRCSSRV